MTRDPSQGERVVLEQRRLALERKIASLWGKPVFLRLNSNRRTYYSIRFPAGAPARLSLHRCFAEAPDEIVVDVVSMMSGRDPPAGARCRAYVEGFDRERVSNGPPPALPPRLRRAKGRWRDLGPIAEEVVARDFHEMAPPRVCWGEERPAGARRVRGRSRRANRPKRSSIRLGSYDQTLDLVRVHPVLDSPHVPVFYLDYLLYHELLHRAFGLEEADEAREGQLDHGDLAPGAKRRRVHHAAFRERERQHSRYREARRWEKGFLEKLFGGKWPPVEALLSGPDQGFSFIQLGLFDDS